MPRRIEYARGRQIVLGNSGYFWQNRNFQHRFWVPSRQSAARGVTPSGGSDQLIPAGGIVSIPPEVLEPRRRQLRVPDRVLDVLMAEIRLKGSRIVASIRQRKAACVSEHVGMRLEAELGLDACPLDHPGETGGTERRAAFRGKDERRSWLLFALKPAERP